MSTLIKTPSPTEERFLKTLSKLPESPRRARAFEAFAAHGLPHRRIEGWRWSDMRAAVKAGSKGRGSVALASPFEKVDAYVFMFENNRLIPPVDRPEGIRWLEKQDSSSFGAAEEMPVAALASALSNTPATLEIEIVGQQKKPIHFVFDAKSIDFFANISLILRDGAKATILETHLGGGEFSSVAVDYVLEPSSTLDRIVYQAGMNSAVQCASAKVNLHAGSVFNQYALSFGAKLSRIETRVVHKEEGSIARLNGAYLLDDGYHTDFTSHIRHTALRPETRQLTKGAVKSGGKGVFQGKFFVARDAQKTDATMAHNALLLEDGAEVNSKPELEIYADDVQCAHGNTMGALDKDALFYMRQRGVGLKEAKAMLTQSFISEAFDSMHDDHLQTLLKEEASQWLMQSL